MTVKYWFEQQVLDWINSLNADSEYARIFRNHKINRSALLTFNDEKSLRELGISPNDNIPIILCNIDRLKDTSDNILKPNSSINSKPTSSEIKQYSNKANSSYYSHKNTTNNYEECKKSQTQSSKSFWKNYAQNLLNTVKYAYKIIFKMGNPPILHPVSIPSSVNQKHPQEEASPVFVEDSSFDFNSDKSIEYGSKSISDEEGVPNTNCPSTNATSCKNSESKHHYQLKKKRHNNLVNLTTDQIMSTGENEQDLPKISGALMNSYRNKGRRNIRHIQEDMAMNQTSLLNSSQVYCKKRLEEFTNRQTEFIQNYLNHKIRETLKPHQIDGIEFMWNNLVTKEQGCVLAQAMGLGKSLQVILVLDALFKVIDNSLFYDDGTLFYKRALIICPAYLQQNWIQEFEKWKFLCQFKGCRITSLLNKRSGEKYAKIQTWRDNGHIIIMSSNTFSNLNSSSSNQLGTESSDIKEALFNPGPSLVIVDEAHEIKSKTTQFYKALSSLKTRLRICLTGSPLQNNLLEYYNMIDFATPGSLCSKEEFCRQFKNPIENGFYLDSKESDKVLSEKQLKKLIQTIKPIVFRLGNHILNQYIPPKKEFEISIKLSKLQRQIYNQFLVKLNQKGSKNVIENESTALLLCNHPIITKSYLNSLDTLKLNLPLGEKNQTIERDQIIWLKEIFSQYSLDLLSQNDVSLKFEICVSIISQSMMKNEKLLIFSRSIPTLKYIYQYLSGKINKSLLYYTDGETSPKSKMSLVNRFNKDDNPSIFLISIKSGSHGINLHTASRIIIFDIGWNPSIDEQAIGRSYRIGQAKPVVVYRLRTSNTWEDELYPINQKKKTMFQKVIDQEEAFHQFNKNKSNYFCIRKDEVAQMEKNYESGDDIIKAMLEKNRSNIVDIKLV